MRTTSRPRTWPGRRALFACAAAGAALACTPEEVGGDAAIAVIEPTRGHQVEGTVRFESLRDEGGVRVVADLTGLSPGPHAFHVHELGDCGEEAAAAGPHFDFLSDAGRTPDRITGNLGELDVDTSGEVRIEADIGMARLAGTRSIIGRSVVVHARGNDPSAPPDGDAGERVGCGVIERADPRRLAADS